MPSFLPRLTFIPVVCFTALLLAAACGDDSAGAGSTTGSGVKVVATTTQIGALARAVAGDNIQLTVLLAPGASAHEYEPNPDAIRRINAAALVLKNGIGLDDWLDKTIQGAGGKNVVTVTDGIKTEKAESGDEAGEDDPHVWQDPANDQVMLANIVKALVAADPAHAALFQQSGDAYAARLDEVDKQIRALIDSIPQANRKLVTNHDAFGYFIRRYGFEYIGAIIPSASESAEPSARSIADLEDVIRKTGVKAIFAEEELDPKIAKQIAADTGAKIVTDLYADSLGKPGSGAETIDGMLLSNARKIAAALK